MVLLYLFPPSLSLSLSLAPLLSSLTETQSFQFQAPPGYYCRVTLILLDTMGRVISCNPIIFKKYIKLNLIVTKRMSGKVKL